MVEEDSQKTVAYSYSTARCWRASDKTYSASDRDTNGYSDISDTELSQACDVLLQQRDVLTD